MSSQKNCTADICWNESQLPCCAVVLEPRFNHPNPPGYTQLFLDHCKVSRDEPSVENVYESFVETYPTFFLFRCHDVDTFKSSFYHEVLLNDGTSYYKKCTDEERNLFVQQKLNETEEKSFFVEETGFDAVDLIPTANESVEETVFEKHDLVSVTNESVEEITFVSDTLVPIKNDDTVFDDGVCEDTIGTDNAISEFVDETGFGSQYYLNLEKGAKMIILQSKYDSKHLPDFTGKYREYRNQCPRKKIPIRQLESKFYVPFMTTYPKFFPNIDMEHLSGIFYKEINENDKKYLVPIPDKERDLIIQKDIQANGERKKLPLRLPTFIASMRTKIQGRQHKLKPVLERLLNDIEKTIVDSSDSRDLPRDDAVIKQCKTVVNKFYDTVFDARAKKKQKTSELVLMTTKKQKASEIVLMEVCQEEWNVPSSVPLPNLESICCVEPCQTVKFPQAMVARLLGRKMDKSFNDQTSNIDDYLIQSLQASHIEN